MTTHDAVWGLGGAMRGAAFRDPTSSDRAYQLDVERAGVAPPKTLVGEPVVSPQPEGGEEVASSRAGVVEQAPASEQGERPTP